MGNVLFDHYSLLHAAVGIVCFYWGIPIDWGVILHIIFELVENSAWGVNFIDNTFTKDKLVWFGWPGGKEKPDAPINMFGDTISFAIGWLLPLLIWPQKNLPVF